MNLLLPGNGVSPRDWGVFGVDSGHWPVMMRQAFKLQRWAFKLKRPAREAKRPT
jgi:hypothetical protein